MGEWMKEVFNVESYNNMNMI